MPFAELMDLDVEVATKTKVSIQDAPSIVSVITANEIKNVGARDIEDILKSVPGIDAVCDYFGNSRIAVRGLFSLKWRNNKIKIMLNGHSLSTAYSGDPMKFFRTIPLDNIEKIEIIRGPGSALYGENAFVGVINIITKDGTAPCKASLKAGSFETYKTPRNWHMIMIFRIYLFTDYYKTDGPELDVESDMVYEVFVLSVWISYMVMKNGIKTHITKSDFSLMIEFYHYGFFLLVSCNSLALLCRCNTLSQGCIGPL